MNSKECNMATGKRTYQDSVFRDLFTDKKYLLRLYQELHPEDMVVTTEDLEIITIENVLVNAIYNDLCFRVKNRLIILVEHQSTINDNMPLRMLFYLAEELQRYVVKDNIYKSKRILIPTPEFYLVYTGKAKQPEEIRFSDAFVDQTKESSIELKVKVVQTGTGILKEYIDLVHFIAYYQQNGLSLDGAIEAALDQCIHNNILTEYLQEKRWEVCRMFRQEFDFEVYERVIKEEAKEEGIELGKIFAKKVMRLHLEGKSNEEIAVTLEVPVETVNEFLED